jgi:hypothetical protein
MPLSHFDLTSVFARCIELGSAVVDGLPRYPGQSRVEILQPSANPLFRFGGVRGVHRACERLRESLALTDQTTFQERCQAIERADCSQRAIVALQRINGAHRDMEQVVERMLGGGPSPGLDSPMRSLGSAARDLLDSMSSPVRADVEHLLAEARRVWDWRATAAERANLSLVVTDLWGAICAERGLGSKEAGETRTSDEVLVVLLRELRAARAALVRAGVNPAEAVRMVDALLAAVQWLADRAHGGHPPMDAFAQAGAAAREIDAILMTAMDAQLPHRGGSIVPSRGELSGREHESTALPLPFLPALPPPEGTAPPRKQEPEMSVLAVFQALERIIRQTLNNPNVEAESGGARISGPISAENLPGLLMIQLGSLVDAPNIDSARNRVPSTLGPRHQLTLALDAARAAIAVHPEAIHLQALWRELCSHRLYDTRFDQESCHWAVYRPVDDSLLGNLLDAARAADPTAPAENETPTLDVPQVRCALESFRQIVAGASTDLNNKKARQQAGDILAAEHVLRRALTPGNAVWAPESPDWSGNHNPDLNDLNLTPRLRAKLREVWAWIVRDIHLLPPPFSADTRDRWLVLLDDTIAACHQPPPIAESVSGKGPDALKKLTAELDQWICQALDAEIKEDDAILAFVRDHAPDLAYRGRKNQTTPRPDRTYKGKPQWLRDPRIMMRDFYERHPDRKPKAIGFTNCN